MAKPIKLKNGSADPDPCPLSKGNHEEAMWISEDQDYTVDFRGNSPFDDPGPFQVPARGNKQSGPIRSNASHGRYHYDLRSAMGAGADPDVDINP